MLKTMKFINLIWETDCSDIYQNKLDDLLEKEKSEKSLTFTDFDDTLVSRLPQLNWDKRFRENRWEKGIKLVKEVIWLENFLKKYYSSKFIVKDILNRTNIILTAWDKELQEWKLNYTNIDKEAIIVQKHQDKPIYILKYILDYLWQIPKEIIFIDDKAFKVEEDMQKLSKILNTRVVLQNITLDEKNFVENYTIEQKIFQNWEKVILKNWEDIYIFSK